ncbi:MAG: hypothetical protein PHU28_06910 [Methanosarcinaceae archaeon]|nr:hypothetical protein [Methanosarcinaceae archaeon]
MQDFVVAKIKKQFFKKGNPAKVPLINRARFFEAKADMDGIYVDSLDKNSFFPWKTFEEAFDFIQKKGGSVKAGNPKTTKLGEPGFELDTLEGHLAQKVYGCSEGERVFRGISLIACILIWAGLCRKEKGEFVSLKAGVEENLKREGEEEREEEKGEKNRNCEGEYEKKREDKGKKGEEKGDENPESIALHLKVVSKDLELNVLESKLAKKDERLAELSTELEARDKRICELEAAISKRAGRLEKLEETFEEKLSGKEKELKGLEVCLRKKEAINQEKFEKLEKEAEDKAIRIQAFETKLAKQAERMQELETKLLKKTERIQELELRLIDNPEKVRVDLEGEDKAKDKKLQEMQNLLEKLKLSLNSKEEEVSRLDQEIRKYKTQQKMAAEGLRDIERQKASKKAWWKFW